jgi:hypothetical protein
VKFLVDNQLPAALARFSLLAAWIASMFSTLTWPTPPMPKFGNTPAGTIAFS